MAGWSGGRGQAAVAAWWLERPELVQTANVARYNGSIDRWRIADDVGGNFRCEKAFHGAHCRPTPVARTAPDKEDYRAWSHGRSAGAGPACRSSPESSRRSRMAFFVWSPCLYMSYRLSESDITRSRRKAGCRSPDLQVKESGENRPDNERFIEPAFRAIDIY